MADPREDAAANKVIAMPADTNPLGDIFGVWLMCQMNLAAGSVAERRAEGRAVAAYALYREGCVRSTNCGIKAKLR